jgi:hypothetical protein
MHREQSAHLEAQNGGTDSDAWMIGD